MGKLKKLNKLNGKGIISYTPNEMLYGMKNIYVKYLFQWLKEYGLQINYV